MVKRERKKGLFHNKKGVDDAIIWTIIILATLVVVLIGVGVLSGKFSAGIKYMSDLLSFK